MDKSAIIKKEKGKYCVRSENNKSWNGGCYKSKSKAEKRLRQVEAFKHMSKSDDGVVSMAADLGDMAKYLEEAGFMDYARNLKTVSYILDGESDSDTFYILDSASNIPADQRNTGGPIGMYNGGVGHMGSPSFGVDSGTMAADDILELCKIADELDDIGDHVTADAVDNLIKCKFKGSI